MLNPIEPALDYIFNAFCPKPFRCQINGKIYLIEKIAAGWSWRNEDGDTQQDFGVEEPFPSAVEAQQDAIRHVQQGAA
jgi:hypothetical protein